VSFLWLSLLAMLLIYNAARHHFILFLPLILYTLNLKFLTFTKAQIWPQLPFADCGDICIHATENEFEKLNTSYSQNLIRWTHDSSNIACVKCQEGCVSNIREKHDKGVGKENVDSFSVQCWSQSVGLFS